MKLKRGVKILLIAIAVFAAVGFAGQQARNRFLTDIIINIKDEDNNYFINETDILAIINNQGISNVSSSRLEDVNLKELEMRIKSYNFVADCQVSRNLKGNLLVEVEQNRPVARIMRQNTKGEYITENGLLMPLSNKFTARVVVITGTGTELLNADSVLQKNQGKELFEFLSYIDKNSFWKAQIAQIEIDKKYNLTLYMQVGSQQIEFGAPKDFLGKLEKLQIFYKEIVPVKGWNGYKRVNLKYQNQIICE